MALSDGLGHRWSLQHEFALVALAEHLTGDLLSNGVTTHKMTPSCVRVGFSGPRSYTNAASRAAGDIAMERSVSTPWSSLAGKPQARCLTATYAFSAPP
jgi:hypothetical protein